MNRLGRAIPLALAPLLLGCDGPTAPDTLAPGARAPSTAVSAEAACYPVTFEVASWFGQPPYQVEGVMTGDLTGTIGVNFDPSTLKIAGKTASIEGTIRFNVTGGVLPVALPLVFTGEFVQLNLNHDSGASPGTVSEQNTTTRATSGVRAANLTMHGSFDATVGIAYHTFRGVICP